MPSVLDKTLKKHRRRLIEREEAAFRELLDAYAVIERDLNAQIRELQRRVAAAREAGQEISPSWFSRERRLRSLLTQVKEQIVRFGLVAVTTGAKFKSVSPGEMQRIISQVEMVHVRIEKAGYQTYEGNLATDRAKVKAHSIKLEPTTATAGR